MLDARDFNKLFRKAADAAGLIDLRHTFASVALAAHAPITDVARWLGHTSVDVTFKIYSHFVLHHPYQLGLEELQAS